MQTDGRALIDRIRDKAEMTSFKLDWIIDVTR